MWWKLFDWGRNATPPVPSSPLSKRQHGCSGDQARCWLICQCWGNAYTPNQCVFTQYCIQGWFSVVSVCVVRFHLLSSGVERGQVYPSSRVYSVTQFDHELGSGRSLSLGATTFSSCHLPQLPSTCIFKKCQTIPQTVLYIHWCLCLTRNKRGHRKSRILFAPKDQGRCPCGFCVVHLARGGRRSQTYNVSALASIRSAN